MGKKSFSDYAIQYGDYIGQKFGHITVLSFAGHDKNRCPMYNCKCDCGTELIVRRNALKIGRTKSCGCPLSTRNKIWDLNDIIGSRYNKWTVIYYWGKKNSAQYYWCCCDCGTEKEVSRSHLIDGSSKDCGCGRRINLPASTTRHGLTNSSEYNSWRAMKERCMNPNSSEYRNYGGRGITICDRWINSFEDFLADMGTKPSKKHSIDRIMVDGNYEPSNCVWATFEDQAQNKRNTRKISYNGDNGTIRYWSEKTGISIHTIAARYAAGWTPEDILTIPVIMGHKPHHNKPRQNEQ